MNITNLTDDQKRIAIAEALGSKWIKDGFGEWHLRRPDQIAKFKPEWVKENSNPSPEEKEGFRAPRWVPDYVNDLNAMADASHTLSDDAFENYLGVLQSVCGIKPPHLWGVDGMLAIGRSTAHQQANAFLLSPR